MELVLDVLAFALPLAFFAGVSRMTQGAKSPVRRVREPTADERQAMTDWDKALMEGRTIRGDKLEEGHRLQLETGGCAVWAGEDKGWVLACNKEPVALIAAGNKYYRADFLTYE